MTAETSWTAVENALVAAVVSGCGLTSRHVGWDYYAKAPRPAPPFVEMSLSDITMQGEDWVVYDDAPDPQPGAELRVRVRGIRSVELVLQAFGTPDGPGGGGSTGWPILTRFVSSLALQYTALDDAGIGVGDVGPVQSISGKKGGVLEPRARCRLTLWVGSELEGRETFIERVQLTLRTADPSITLTSVELSSL